MGRDSSKTLGKFTMNNDGYCTYSRVSISNLTTAISCLLPFKIEKNPFYDTQTPLKLFKDDLKSLQLRLRFLQFNIKRRV